MAKMKLPQSLPLSLSLYLPHLIYLYISRFGFCESGLGITDYRMRNDWCNLLPCRGL